MSKDLKSMFSEMVHDYLKNEEGIFFEAGKSLLLNGKNIRPLIFLNIIEPKKKISQIDCKLAVAIELLHCASLIIDDLPSMDNDNLRRGEPTLHIKYGVDKAQLISNKFIFDAVGIIFNYCDESCRNLVLNQLKNAAIGQYYDLNCVDGDAVSINEVSFKINLKTAPFFNIAFILANFSLKNSLYKEYTQIGNLFSAMFQICDDIEDYKSDLEKNHKMNHCIILGKKRSLHLYKKNKSEFIDYIVKFDLRCEYFDKIIQLLDSKLNN